MLVQCVKIYKLNILAPLQQEVVKCYRQFLVTSLLSAWNLHTRVYNAIWYRIILIVLVAMLWFCRKLTEIRDSLHEKKFVTARVSSVVS